MGTDKESDETPEERRGTRSTAAELIAELNSHLDPSSIGPAKRIQEVTLEHAAFDPANNEMTVKIAIHASHEGLHNEEWDGRQCFQVTLKDMTQLAEMAPRLKPSFVKLAAELTAQLEKERAAYQRAILDWCDAGLPTQEQTTVFKPLQLKYKIG
ncbi:MAG: hypothetical protein ACAH83_17415 [Alphaproteobacteria bacterium]